MDNDNKSIRDAVRESWLRKAEADEKKRHSEVEVRKSAKRKPEDEVISLLSDEDEEDSLKEIQVVRQPIRKKLKTAETQRQDPPKVNNSPSSEDQRIAHWPFRPIHNPTYDIPKLSNSVTINNILSCPDLKQTFLFSFQYSLPFILPAIPSCSTPVTIVHQPGTIVDSPLRSTYNVSLIEVRMPAFTSHHPKLIVNFYDDGGDVPYAKIFMISANLTELEFSMNNQMVWESPKIPRRNQQSISQFKTHFFQWVESYNKSLLKHTLLKELENYDFSPIIGDFIASSSGSFKNFGYLSLYQSLKDLDLIPTTHDNPTQILYQSSSIGAPFSVTKDGPGNIFTHLIAPMIQGLKFPITNGPTSLVDFESTKSTKLYVIFPSVNDIKDSRFGYNSGGWSHYNPNSKNGQLQHSQILSSRLYRPYSFSRGTNTSHTKFIIVSHDNFKTLEWVLFTSANLSKTAWGNKQKANGDVNISNFETGILISKKHYKPSAKLVPLTIGENKVLKEDEIAIQLPFKLPPEKYKQGDEPWCLTKPYYTPDVTGARHDGL